MKQMLTATLLSNIDSCPATVSQSAGIGGYAVEPGVQLDVAMQVLTSS